MGSKRKEEIDWQGIYERMEPADRAVIDAWVKKLSAYTTARGGAGAMDAVFVDGMGKKSALELCIKLARLVVLNDPICRSKP